MFDDNNNQQRTPRPMVQGDWKCADCGGQITELPFQPREGAADNLKCRECFKSNRPERGGQSRSDRPMVEGNWKCADCDKEITKLPFEPREDRPVRCSDCHRASRSN